MRNFTKNINMKTVKKTVVLFLIIFININILFSQNITDSIKVYFTVNRNQLSWQQDPSNFHPEIRECYNRVITDKKDIKNIEKRVSKIKLKNINYFFSSIKCIAYRNGKESYYIIIGSHYNMYKDAKYFKPDNKITRILSKYLPKDEFTPRRCFLIRLIKRGYYII